VVESLADQFDALDIGAAAAKLALEATRGEEAFEEGRDLPQWEPAEERERDSGRGPRKRRDRAETPGSRSGGQGASGRIFVGMGRRRGLRPGDLVGAIVNEAGIPASAIGAIEIADQFSLVEITENHIDRVISVLSRASLKGRRVGVRRARD
jgi:ATP-dependent RNA helicase DeaD